MKMGSGKIVKSTSVSDERVIRSEPQNGGSFPLDRATPPASLSFASQKRILAFYSSMENAPFGVNRSDNAILENVCRNSMFFARFPEMALPDGQSGAVAKPDLGGGMQLSGRGCLRQCMASPRASAGTGEIRLGNYDFFQ